MPPARKAAAKKAATPRKKPAPPLDAAKAEKVLELRRAGVRFESIANTESLELGGDVEAAVELFDLALRNLPRKFEPGLEADRIERLWAAIYPKAARGDVQAIDRAVKLSERREKLLADPKPNDHNLRKAFDRSAETSADLIDGLDDALVAAGRAMADRVDEALANGEGQEVTKALYLVPHLNNILREMLATPSARVSAGVGKGAGNGKRRTALGDIRGLAGGKKSS